MKEPKTYNSQTPVLVDKNTIFLTRIREKKREELRRQREQGFKK